jgi:ribonuclease HI
MGNIQIYFDGGCKPNPGQMEICIVIVGDGAPQPMTIFDLGYGTNIVAEWSALLWAASVAKERGYKGVEFIGDNITVLNQADNKWKIKERSFLSFKMEFMQLNHEINGSLSHIPRAQNRAGTFLESGIV